MNRRVRAYVERNRDRVYQNKKDRRARNLNTWQKKDREYYARNRDVLLAHKNAWLETDRYNLHDCYVKQILVNTTGMSRKLITAELIKSKREILAMKRTVKQIREMMQ